MWKRCPYVIPDFSLSCFLWKVVPRLLCIFSANMLNISAFRIHHVENTDNCQDYTIYSWPTFVLEGEPTVLKCLQFKNRNPFDLSLNLTWKKKDSLGIIPVGFKGPRIMSQGDAVWLLPTILQDSGEYICTQRNSSYCAKVSIHLKVVKRNETNNISYPQKAFLLSSGKIVCPNLENFIQNNTNYELKWYKDSTRLNMDNKKFTALEGTNYLLINPISMHDSGYYTCEMTFAFEKEQYNITRIVQLQILEKKEKNIPLIANPNERITSVALGSHLTIPCRVFIGANNHSDVDVWWLANNSYIQTIYPDGRVKEGETGQFVENNNRSIEVELIFDSITEADFHTDFRCVAQNVGGNRIQTVTVKEKKKDRELSWHLAVVPVAVAVVIIGGVYLSKYWKQRSTKGYVVASS
ncbi:interleukin-1 receptor type 2 isoform X2 [Notechis scutatus]|uniref:Interleukin-1 receptor type 2 isoform X2 n=1 Tax=Notechis scutatus TaxID=8663 RepID=A0A6J1U3X1_9SAUR|nr:interleukin-1 receptor type 2 isoform X2 [Notechis scutatus]